MTGDELAADLGGTAGGAMRLLSLVPPDVLAEAQADAAAAAAPSSAPSSAPGAAPGAAPAPAFDYDAEAAELVAFACVLFIPLYPSLEKIYTTEVQHRIAVATAPLMRKYDMNIGRLGPELAFAITVLPLAVPTYHAIRHDNAERAAAARSQAHPAASTAPSSDTAPAGSTTMRASEVQARPDDTPLARFPGQT